MRALAASLLWLLLLAAFPAAGSDRHWPMGEQARSELPAPAALLRTHDVQLLLPRAPEASGKGPSDPDIQAWLPAALLAASGAVLWLWQQHPSRTRPLAARQRRPAAPRAPPVQLSLHR